MNSSNQKGWVRLHRKIENNPLYFLESFTKAQAWIDLFLNANHKDGFINIRGNIVPIKRGQLGWSEITMMARWKWSKGKVNRFLKLLETIQQITQQKDRYITTIITILKYEQYQSDTADSTADGQQTVQQTIHKQEVKNEKNEKKRGFTPPSLKEIEEYYKERGYTRSSPETFFNYYESNGWLVGKNKMKSWHASLAGWESRDKKEDKNELDNFNYG